MVSARAAQGVASTSWREGGCQVAIAGGGLVGTSLALALGAARVRVALIEASVVGTRSDSGYDARPIALSQGSRRILDALGVWERLRPSVTAITRVHVSDRGRFGFARMSAAECGVDALGYVVAAADLGAVLESALTALDSVRILRPALVEDVEQERTRAARLYIAAADGEAESELPAHLDAALMVLCDGGRSPLRRRLGIPVSERDYGQWAVTARVEARCAHHGVAYERFTADGPLALLPMPGKHCGLVWSVHAQASERLVALDDEAFVRALTHQFGMRLGGFVSAGPRAAFPVGLVTATQLVGERLAVIGNAANHLHPVAGQGLNLGLRDAAALAEVVASCVQTNTDPGERAALVRYAEWRRRDQKVVSGATDALVRLFSNRLGALALARDLGLLAFDLLPPLKRRFASHAMGLAGRQSRLARRLPL